MRAALIDPTGLVDNVIELPDEEPDGEPYTPPDDHRLVVLGPEDLVGVGWHVDDDGTWTPPEPPPVIAGPVDPDALERLTSVLKAAGILTQEQLDAILG